MAPTRSTSRPSMTSALRAGWPDTSSTSLRFARVGLLAAALAGCATEPDDSTPDVPDDPVTPGDPGDGILGVDALSAGDLVLTELMVDPLDCPDDNGQYVEILNKSAKPVDLDGLRIEAGATSAVVRATVVVQPGEVALGRRSPVPGCHDEAEADFVYTNLTLDLEGGEVRLANATGPLDAVDTSGFVLVPGRAVGVKAGRLDATSNDEPSAWCFQSTRLSPTGRDAGSPGLPNDACRGSVEAAPIDKVRRGELIISEFLYGAAECPLEADQYLEVHNTSDRPIDLYGMRFETVNGSHTVEEDLVVGPHREVVLRYPFGCLSSNYEADYTYVSPLFDGFLGDWFRLSKPDLFTGELTLLDEVDARGWGVQSSGSYSLDPDELDAASNDESSAWCVTQVKIPDSQTGGTPGTPNDCSSDDDTGIDYGLVQDSGVYTVGQVEFTAAVAGNQVVRGQVIRRAGTRTARAINAWRPYPAQDWTCWWSWPIAESTSLPTADICPSCTLGFEVSYGPREDWLPIYARTASRSCGQYFSSVGGTPTSLPDRRLFYSPVYGGVFYEDDLGSLQPYSYGATYTPAPPGAGPGGILNIKLLTYVQPVP